jgi:hypothetical protein
MATFERPDGVGKFGNELTPPMDFPPSPDELYYPDREDYVRVDDLNYTFERINRYLNSFESDAFVQKIGDTMTGGLFQTTKNASTNATMLLLSPTGLHGKIVLAGGAQDSAHTGITFDSQFRSLRLCGRLINVGGSSEDVVNTTGPLQASKINVNGWLKGGNSEDHISTLNLGDLSHSTYLFGNYIESSAYDTLNSQGSNFYVSRSEIKGYSHGIQSKTEFLNRPSGFYIDSLDNNDTTVSSHFQVEPSGVSIIFGNTETSTSIKMFIEETGIYLATVGNPTARTKITL